MSFSLEIGKNKILKYSFESFDSFDNEQLEALYNINAQYLVDVQKIFRDGEMFLEYNITEYLELKDYIRRLIENRQYNVEEASAILLQIINAMMDISNYFSLTTDNVELSLEHVFWDIKQSKVKLIYLPKTDINTGLQENLMSLIRDFELVSGDNSNVIAFFVVQMNYLRDNVFHLERFKENIEKKSQGQSSQVAQQVQSYQPVQPAQSVQKSQAYQAQQVKPVERISAVQQSQLNQVNQQKQVVQTQPTGVNQAGSYVFSSQSATQTTAASAGKQTSKKEKKSSSSNIRVVILFNIIFVIVAFGVAQIMSGESKELDISKLGGLLLLLLAVGNYILLKLGFFKRKDEQDQAKSEDYARKETKPKKEKKQKKEKVKTAPSMEKKNVPSFMKKKNENPSAVPVQNKLQDSRVEVVESREPQSYVAPAYEESYEYSGGTQFISEDQGTQFIAASNVSTGASLYIKSKKSNAPLTFFPCIVGRVQGKSDIVVNSPSVSGAHIRMEKHNDCYYVVDLDSKNGTSINGLKIRPNEMNQVKDGDTIMLSNEELTFRING